MSYWPSNIWQTESLSKHYYVKPRQQLDRIALIVQVLQTKRKPANVAGFELARDIAGQGDYWEP
jgi:hypothetical protein